MMEMCSNVSGSFSSLSWYQGGKENPSGNFISGSASSVPLWGRAETAKVLEPLIGQASVFSQARYTIGSFGIRRKEKIVAHSTTCGAKAEEIPEKGLGRGSLSYGKIASLMLETFVLEYRKTLI